MRKDKSANKISYQLTMNEGTSGATMHMYYQNNRLCHQDVYRRINVLSKALADLQQQNRIREASQISPVEDEIRGKVEQEIEQKWKNRILTMETKLQSAERQLNILQEENDVLRHQQLVHFQHTSVDLKSPPIQNGFISNGYTKCQCPHVNMDEGMKMNEKKLQDELRESEKRAHRLNLMLDEKLVELNSLQLAHSQRTKEMVLLEKAYLQLRYHLFRSNRTLKQSTVSPATSLQNGKTMDDPP